MRCRRCNSDGPPIEQKFSKRRYRSPPDKPLSVKLPIVFVTILKLFLLASLPATGTSKDAKSVIRALEARYHHASTLKAQFFESYVDGKGGGSAESGTVYFSKPGRMRWEYESPQEKLFLVDGKNVWFYVPADRTASRAKIGESSDWRTPLAFLTGKADLTRLCRSIEIVEPKTDGGPVENPSKTDNAVLRCIPRVEASDTGEEIRDVLLEVDPDARLVRIVIQQPGNLTTEFRFGSWEENVPLPETKFRFVPPAGVAVLDEASLAATMR
jgi:outer membrane lipoprotein carrier protein